MERTRDKLIGYIDPTEKPVFESYSNDRKFLNFYNQDGEKFLLKGYFKEIPTGFITVFGVLEPPKPPYRTYSFNLEHYSSREPESAREKYLLLKKFFELSENQISKIQDKFGSEFINVLDEDIDKIDELKLFKKEKKLKDFKTRWQEESHLRGLRAELYDYGISESQVKDIFAKYKNQTLDKVKTNPFCLLTINGIGFKKADEIWIKRNGSLVDEKRLLAAMYYLLKNACLGETGKEKNFFVYLDDFLQKYQRELGIQIDRDTFLYYVNVLENPENFKLDSEIYKKIKRLNISGRDVLYPYEHFKWETETAEIIATALIDGNIKEIEITDEEFLNDGIAYNKEQIASIREVFNSKVSIIDGQGGTGKSTIIKKIINLAKKNNLTYTLLAPTGKAVDVLINISGEPKHCSTIHRKLMMQGEEGSEPKEMINEDIVIIDESGMKALPLLYSTLKGFDFFISGANKRIVFVGDEDQLRPVGLGNPFLDLILSGLIPLTKLIEIYRQRDDSLILENCRKIRNQEIIDLSKKSDDFEFIDIEGYKNSSYVDFLTTRIFEKEKWNDESVILAFGYKGEEGVPKINDKMQSLIQENNKYKYENQIQKFYIGDRIMYVDENWYREKEKNLEGFPVEIILNSEYRKKITSLIEYHGTEDDEEVLIRNNMNGNLEKSIFQNSISFEHKTNTFLSNGIKNLSVGQFLNGDIIENVETSTTFLDKNVYNGNWGKIVACKTKDGWYGLNESTGGISKIPYDEIKLDAKTEYVLLVKFSNQYIFIPEKKLGNVSLFYASTVHKAQGSQFENVYVSNTAGNAYFADKYWLYTAFSRAKTKLLYFSTIAQNKKVQNEDFRKKITIFEKGFFSNFLNYYINDRKNKKVNKIDLI